MVLFFYLFIFLLLLNAENLVAKEKLNTNNTYGVPGLIDMPVAGSFDDGQIAFSSSKVGPNLRNTISFQALPRFLVLLGIVVSVTEMLIISKKVVILTGTGVLTYELMFLKGINTYLK